jgi:signal transduction histidine kinase
MNLLRTTAFQLALLYAVMLIGSTMVVAVVLYWATIGYLQRQTDTTIEVEIAGLREQYQQRGLNGLVRVIRERLQSAEDPGAIYLFADRRLRPLAGNLPAWPELVNRADGWHTFTNQHRQPPVPARARVLLLPEGLVLLVGRDVSDLRALLQRGFTALLWSGGLVVLLGLLGGALLSRNVRSRVDTLNQVMQAFADGEFQRRVPVRGTGDEFDQLAASLNAMLDRTNQLMEDVRHVGDSIAHELRTPLTRLRHSLEQIATDITVEDMREQALQATEDADRLLAIFSALLRIARIESGTYKRRFEPVSLAQLIDDAVEMYDVVAEEAGIEIRQEILPTPVIPGDRDLIFQAMANLLDNALKHTPAGGIISLSLSPADQSAVFSIADTGGGLPTSEIDLVTRRFYRSNVGRQPSGSGLGLSLVNAVAQLHTAQLKLENTDAGLQVSLRFPLA